MEFDTWLGDKLQQIGLDETVFAPYITSILDEDEEDLTVDERTESVKSLLAEACSDDDQCTTLSVEIIRRWKASRAAVAQKTAASMSSALKVDLVQQLAGITASHQSAYDKAASSKSAYQPDSALKAAVLAQYDSAAAGEEQEEEVEEVGSEDEERNANAEAVAKADAEKREKARAAAAEKKQKDKDDRENQKKGAEERKKKAQDKAAKGERRK